MSQKSEKKLDRKHFTMEEEILKKKTVINGILYTPTVVPDVLKDCLLILAHDKQGHNGFKRTYSSLKQLYHLKGMKKTIQRHCNACSTCAKHNIKVQQIQKEHFKVPPQLMEFIAMDLIGEFHSPPSKGNGYALTAVCMLTGFTFCIPIKSKKVEEVMKAYKDNICCVFGPLKKILTDNGTEFKNKLWTAVFKRMHTEHWTSSIYSPQCNGRIEGFHKFLKATIAKQLQKGLEWDDVIPKATSAYNFFLTQSSKEAPFFLMFGQQAAVKHMLLDSESPKYLDNEGELLNIELMRKLYHIIAYNLAKSRAVQDGNKYAKEHYHPRPKVLEPGKNVLVRENDSKVFKPKYLDYCVVKMAGKNQVIVKDNHGHETKVHRRDLKVIDSDTKVAEMYDELRKEGRRDAQHCMPVKQIPDLNWEKENTEKQNTEQNARNETEKRTGQTLRSSKKKQTVNEVKERFEAASNKDKEEICADFLSVAGTVIVAGVYTVASQFINSYIF